MLSKRDQLLVRPWQQKRYDNHRRKIQSALPAIDNSPPFTAYHISLKLKKRQQEIERIAKIERDNLILLRKLSHITKRNPVDNRWNTPPPTFLNRVAVYGHQVPKAKINVEQMPGEKTNHIRKSKCSACTPKVQTPQNVPEERIPWEPEKPPTSRRRSQSVRAKRLSLPIIVEKEEEEQVKPSAQKANGRSKSCKASQRFLVTTDDFFQSPRSFILVRGSLKLVISFPPDTSVKVRDGLSERVLCGGDCYCTSMGKAY